MSSLDTCPFCASEATVKKYGHHEQYYVACTRLIEDTPCTETPLFDTPTEAIAHWQNRVPDKRVRAALGAGRYETTVAAAMRVFQQSRSDDTAQFGLNQLQRLLNEQKAATQAARDKFSVFRAACCRAFTDDKVNAVLKQLGQQRRAGTGENNG